MPDFEYLMPDRDQARPAWQEVQLMCARIALHPVQLPGEPFQEFLERVRSSHDNGGAHLAAFTVGADPIFDWFASRNRLSDDGLIDSLILRTAVREALPEIRIPGSSVETGLKLGDPFLLDGRLARVLYNGGAYSTRNGDGRAEKALAVRVCDAIFELRFGEVDLLESFQAWTPWFKGIAWDITEVLFDRRFRRLWILAITDTD